MASTFAHRVAALSIDMRHHLAGTRRIDATAGEARRS